MIAKPKMGDNACDYMDKQNPYLLYGLCQRYKMQVPLSFC